MATIEYVKKDTVEMTVPGKDSIELLWGDQVRVIDSAGRGRVKIKARGQTGSVARSALGGDPLLEVYFIDVGQGDGVLIVTPDRRHLLIDGGWPRRGQPNGKNAADFVDWKFHRDYGASQIELDAVLCSHNDQDHYGGLWDLLNPTEEDELHFKTSDVKVERFFHAGLSWWKTPNDSRTLGRSIPTDEGDMFVDLIDDRASVLNGLKANANPKLQGEWAKFLRCVTKAKNRAGQPTPMQRLGHAAEYLPGYEAGQSDVAVRVLAPVEFDVGGRTAIHKFPGSESKSTNGNSLLLRLDYGRSRMLLTGDLNLYSMQSLLKDWAGQRAEFACDVAKGCHHGSDDISYAFLAAMRPAVTVISSGDAEGHDHPRPDVVAASATSGYLEIDRQTDKIVTPLVYSTELARSAKLGKPSKLTLPDGATVSSADLAKSELEMKVTMSGDRNPRTVRRKLTDRSRALAGIVYGLVNVRTDGDKILCATMNEARHDWQVKTLSSRF